MNAFSNLELNTLGARGFSCSVAGVSHVSIVTRAGHSAGHNRDPLAPRV